MKKELKAQIIEQLAAQLEVTPDFYVTDIEGLNASLTSKLRRACFEKQIKLLLVKNTLFYKVLEQRGVENLEEFGKILKGSSAIMFTTVPNAPARLIKEFKEMIGDIVGLLQSPVKNVISALQSQAGGKLAGIVKTLSEKE